MKKVLNCLFLAVLLSSAVFAQAKGWKAESVFPADSSMNGGVHGLATDPDGKVWVVQYYAIAKDSLKVKTVNADTTAVVEKYTAVRAIHVFNPDGTEASFSPIYFNKVGGVVKDTLGGQTIFISKSGSTTKLAKWDVNSGRGVVRDYDGNMLVTYWDWIYKFNYKTGEGMMNRINCNYGTTFGGATRAAVDSLGNIYVRAIYPGAPLKTFDKTGAAGANVTDKAEGYGRLVEVSKDGNMVLNPGYSINVVQRFARASEYDPWVGDTLIHGVACESMTWNKKGQLWFSAGSLLNKPNQEAGVTTKWSANTWYLYDFTSKTTVDSLKWVYFTTKEASFQDERPRAIALSPDESIIYVGTFSNGAVRKYVLGTVGVEQEKYTVVNNYALSQNYPNPFNPTTAINFQLPKESFVSLKVYNALGQEVSTLVSSIMKAGQHTVNFNAANLPSGTYIYRMTAEGVSITSKMLLLK
ncbi:MAG: T9SS type A sorting domain-containing protein [Syntrophomonadaceae bacterium]